MAFAQRSFSETVKRVRSQLGLSQEDFAHALGVSFATINRWENGKTSPSKLAMVQFRTFCDQKVAQGLLSMEEGIR
ncbi:MAG: helix-turn-helix domain-containing protein [Syntrophobacteraceae bacterium]